MTPEERRAAAEHFRRTGQRPGEPTVRESVPNDPPGHPRETLPPATTPTGIGGWLLFLCLNLTVIGPLWSLVSVLEASSSLSLLGNAVITLWGVINAGWSVYAGVSLWRRRPHAVRRATVFLLGSFVLNVAPVVLEAFLLPTSAPPAAATGQVIFRAAIFTYIWALYLRDSKRVRATFAADPKASMPSPRGLGTQALSTGSLAAVAAGPHARSVPRLFSLMTLPPRCYLPLIVTGASGLALLDLPYGYFMLLRMLICGACLYYMSRATAPGWESHRAVLVALAILHNPVIPVHLRDKNLWTAVDFGTAAYFWWLSVKIPPTPMPRPLPKVDDAPKRFPLGGL